MDFQTCAVIMYIIYSYQLFIHIGKNFKNLNLTGK